MIFVILAEYGILVSFELIFLFFISFEIIPICVMYMYDAITKNDYYNKFQMAQKLFSCTSYQWQEN